MAMCRYVKITEWENHLSSYDHHHRKRFKEMQQEQKARTATAQRLRERFLLFFRMQRTFLLWLHAYATSLVGAIHGLTGLKGTTGVGSRGRHQGPGGCAGQ